MTAAKPAVVGGFVLSGLALGIAAILAFGGTHLFNTTVHAVVYFPGSVASLDVGAPVTFRGVRVGSVTSVAVILNMTDLTARIPVFLDVNATQISLKNSVTGEADASFDRLLKAGLRAQLNMQSLITGQLGVDLDLQPGTPANLVGGEAGRVEIPSLPSRLQTLEGEIAELPLKQIADNANRALAAIQEVADALGPRIGPTADSLKQAADDIDQLAITGRRQLSANGDQLGRVLASSDRAVRDADALMASLKEMTAQDSPMRSDLQATLRDLSDSASSLRGFTHEIERDPGALLSGRNNR